MSDRLHIPPDHRGVLESLLREYLPDVEVWAHSSPVDNRPDEGSDLNLALRGPGLEEIPAEQLASFSDALRESTISLLVVVRDWARLPERFQREIEREHVSLHSGEAVPLATLGDYFDLQRGTTYRSRLLDHEGPVLLGLASIHRNGGFRSDSLRKYGGECPDRLMVNPGDLYVSLKDVTQSADLLGAVAMLPACHAPGRLTQDTVKLTPKSDNVRLDYVYWLLRTPEYRHYCRAHATGTTNLGLPREDFLAFPVPPFTSSRCRLVSALNALEDKIDLNRRMNETLEATARALFKSWFVDFEPVLAKADGRTTGLPLSIGRLFPAEVTDSSGGHLPATWAIKRLGECFDLTMGQSPPGRSYNDVGDGLPFYQGRTDFGFRYPSNRRFCTAPSRIAHPGDTLVSVRAPVGDINMASTDCCVGRGVAALRHRSGSSSYTYYAINAIRQDIADFEHTGTVFGAITRKQFEALAVVEPHPDLVQAFESLVGPLDRRIALQEAEAKTLSELRNALLAILAAGELSAPDAERVAAAVV